MPTILAVHTMISPPTVVCGSYRTSLFINKEFEWCLTVMRGRRVSTWLQCLSADLVFHGFFFSIDSSRRVLARLPQASDWQSPQSLSLARAHNSPPDRIRIEFCYPPVRSNNYKMLGQPWAATVIQSHVDLQLVRKIFSWGAGTRLDI